MMSKISSWYSRDKNGVSVYQLKEPYENVYIGSDPRDGMTEETARSFDAIVNVSDTPGVLFEPSFSEQRVYWYPVNEVGRWNLSYLFWLKKIMDHHHFKGHKIYLHCHAGAYRSPSAAILWLQSRGHSAQEALRIGSYRGDDSHTYRLWGRYGNIPRTKDTVFETMRKHPSWSLASVLLSNKHWDEDPWNNEICAGDVKKGCLLKKYFWFYYRPKWYLSDLKQKIGWFFKKCGYKREGICTHIYGRKYFWAWPKNAEPREKRDVEE
jgi:hypothetical protein